MTPLESMTELADELKKASPAIRTELQTLPSGSVLLDVFVDHRFFVIHYIPSYLMYGVDEVKDDDGFGSHYRFGFKDLASARAKLRELMIDIGGPKAIDQVQTLAQESGHEIQVDRSGDQVPVIGKP